MPTYELTCRVCGHRFDLFLMRLLRNEDLLCPQCGARDIERGVGGGILGSGTRSAVSAASSASCGTSRFS